jgi:hypothetical protein
MPSANGMTLVHNIESSKNIFIIHNRTLKQIRASTPLELRVNNSWGASTSKAPYTMLLEFIDY